MNETWPHVASQAISALVTIVTIGAGVLYAYFKLKKELAENTKQTQINSLAINLLNKPVTPGNISDAANKTSEIRSTLDQLTKGTNGIVPSV